MLFSQYFYILIIFRNLNIFIIQFLSIIVLIYRRCWCRVYRVNKLIIMVIIIVHWTKLTFINRIFSLYTLIGLYIHVIIINILWFSHSLYILIFIIVLNWYSLRNIICCLSIGRIMIIWTMIYFVINFFTFLI